MKKGLTEHKQINSRTRNKMKEIATAIKKFNGSNWYEFESDMMYYLMSKKLWLVVKNPSSKPEASDWEEKNIT